ncbi:PfkB family carbohydrate kinase [Algibacillus agarilyticus]|uniref:PfkB family carbohydrate kinase n=1 Tax=Algibacillus agarilyticus TaxID=2234133 RepID=UPI000DD0700F|nr:PfkB family carbohydrate kinase [Algibacillus agarilyticus]
MSVVLDLPSIAKNISNSQQRCVLVTGNFNTLHPGHIRLLKFAKDCGDLLIVGVNCDAHIQNPNYMDEAYRTEVVSALGFVDYCFINKVSIEDVICEIKPNVVVKGVEYQNRPNPETHLIEEFGGKLVFCSGDFSFNSGSSNQITETAPVINKAKLNGFLKHHHISTESCRSTLEKFKELNVVVIGDVIIDQYVQCNAVGMSQEDPTIVVTPNTKDLFLGGAGITAAHAKALGANSVSLFTVTGKDEFHHYTDQKLKDYSVDRFLAIDDTRPTSLKTRYRVGNKTMLRVNEVRNHDIQQKVQNQIFDDLVSIIPKTNVLIFSDFNYGVLPQSLVEKIIKLCKKHNVLIAADSQSSSQVGDISRFEEMDLITPTEREARLAINNTKDGLVLLAEKLRKKCKAKHIVITLAEDGAFLHKPNIEDSALESWDNDKIAALADKAIDPAGAGDCFLASSALALATGTHFWQSSFLGAVAAACQVSRVGNKPLQQSELLKAIEGL